MSSSVSCFDNIIGLSRTPCSDYDLSTDYTTSDSGLFLDELFPLHKAESLLNCKVGENVFTFLEKARDNAIMDFRIDATSLLAERADIRIRPFKGRIGKVKRSEALTSLTTGNYYGMVIRCDDIVGGEIRIVDISTMFDTTGTIDIIVKNNLNETISGSPFTVNTTAGALEGNTVSITLPTHSEYVENLEYYFLFAKGASSPYDNEFYDQDASWSKVYPTKTNKQFGYLNYVAPAGINLTSITDLSDITVTSESRCYGLSLGVEMRCKVEEIWCYDEMDYTDAIDIAIAKAVRLRAASNLIRDIALSENLNRATMIDGQTLGEMDETWTVAYADTLDFIVKNIDISRIDCFECGKEILMGVGKIQS